MHIDSKRREGQMFWIADRIAYRLFSRCDYLYAKIAGDRALVCQMKERYQNRYQISDARYQTRYHHHLRLRLQCLRH